MSTVLAAVVLLAAGADLDAQFQTRVGGQARAENLWVLEWGLANLDGDAALERVAKLCTVAPSRKVLYVFQDDTAPSAEVWAWEVEEAGYEQVTVCPPQPKAPAPWQVAQNELKHIMLAGAGVRSSRSALAWGISVDLGFKKGALVQVGGKTFGTPPPDAAAPPRVHRVDTLGKLNGLLEAERWIHGLVPSDGKMNGVAADRLVELGLGRPEIGDAIVRHVFTAPEAFFSDATEPKERWLPGTRANAASVLCRLRHVAARSTLKGFHDEAAASAHLKEALAVALQCLERP